MRQTQLKGATFPLLSVVVLAAATLCLAPPSYAADVNVTIQGLRNEEGVVRVAVCRESQFTRGTCRHTVSAPAAAGSVTVEAIPPGTYAVQAYHDENENGELDRRSLRRPLEGLGFSRDAPMRFGPPRFWDAAVQIPETGGALSLTMRYFDE